MTGWLRKLWNDESGTAAIEYPLLAALIVLASIGALIQLSGSLDRMFTMVAAKISDLPIATSPAPPPPDDDDDD